MGFFFIQFSLCVVYQTDRSQTHTKIKLFALETMRDRYWHNMAARIQRAWRNFLRYRNECATRIQRFWRGRKDAFEFARVRQKGHELLAGRKERRRYSLVSQRRFAGDYLDVGGKSSGGAMLKQAAGLNGQFSFRSTLRVEAKWYWFRDVRFGDCHL